MRPYGIVVFPEGNNFVQPYARHEHGISPTSKKDDSIIAGIDYPTSVFYETERGRDAELNDLLSRFPNVMFCPVTITTGKKTQPNPKSSEFTISSRGVLPV